jgi:hypothetical protein
MAIATALGWGDLASIALAVALAFRSGACSAVGRPVFRQAFPSRR